MSMQTVDEWIETNFAEGSRPAKTTVWRWIREGKLPARRIGKRYYLTPDQTVPETDLVSRVLQRHP